MGGLSKGIVIMPFIGVIYITWIGVIVLLVDTLLMPRFFEWHYPWQSFYQSLGQSFQEMHMLIHR